jgi:hypothetical protein
MFRGQYVITKKIRGFPKNYRDLSIIKHNRGVKA